MNQYQSKVGWLVYFLCVSANAAIPPVLSPAVTDKKEIAFSQSQPTSLRWKLFMEIVEKGGPEASAMIQKASVHRDWVLRSAALVGVKSLGVQPAKELGLRLLKDKALVVRSEAVNLLKQLPSNPQIRTHLWSELQERRNFRGGQSLWVRKQIVEFLAQNPVKEEKERFLKVLADRDQEVAALGQRGLEKLFGVQLGERETPLKDQHRLWSDWVDAERNASVKR